MRLHPFWIAPFAALLAAGLVAVDATRFGLDARRRLYWAVGVGLVSASGFLGAFLVLPEAYQFYHRLTGQPVVVRTPYEVVLNGVLVGLAVTALAMLAYGIGTRGRPPKPDRS
jgi:hypothetical protein